MFTVCTAAAAERLVLVDGRGSSKIPCPGFAGSIDERRLVEGFAGKSWDGADAAAERLVLVDGCGSSKIPCPGFVGSIDERRDVVGVAGKLWDAAAAAAATAAADAEAPPLLGWDV